MRRGMAKSSESVFRKIRRKFKYGLAMEYILDQLARLGLEIRPYCIFQEGLALGAAQVFGSSFDRFETVFLGLQDMKELDRVDGRPYSEAVLRERLEKGQKCFAAKIDGKVAAFTWCRFDRIDCMQSVLQELKPNEAYLFDTYTLKAWRGGDLAPWLRWRSYQVLAGMGRDVLYSFSDYFNAPAIRFKKKLGARLITLRLHIRLGERYRRHWTLKRYSYGGPTQIPRAI
jgi:hypothetical protein